MWTVFGCHYECKAANARRAQASITITITCEPCTKLKVKWGALVVMCFAIYALILDGLPSAIPVPQASLRVKSSTKGHTREYLAIKTPDLFGHGFLPSAWAMPQTVRGFKRQWKEKSLYLFSNWTPFQIVSFCNCNDLNVQWLVIISPLFSSSGLVRGKAYLVRDERVR